MTGVTLAIFGCLSLGNRMPQAEAVDENNEIDRGRYLVEEVAKCSECRLPRDARGELDQQSWLQGASIWIEPVRPI
jgi:hypothetical protein